jgi:two-component system OmpR family response regulator
MVDSHMPQGSARAGALCNYGFEVLHAVSAEETRKLVEELFFDAFVVDAVLSDGSGVQLCKELRKDGQNVEAAIILQVEPDTKIDPVDYADDVLEAPLAISRLAYRLRKAVARRKAWN